MQRLNLLVSREVRPGRRRDLLASVRPGVGIMKVEQRLQPRGMRAADRFQRVGSVAVLRLTGNSYS